MESKFKKNQRRIYQNKTKGGWTRGKLKMVWLKSPSKANTYSTLLKLLVTKPGT